MSTTDPKISPHNLAELKNTTDDAIGNYLRGLKFTQDNSKLDVRLAIGYTSVIIAAAIFGADYKLGWEATKHWTAAAVVAYGALSAALQYWLWFVEKGVVFEGERAGKKVIYLAASVEAGDVVVLTLSRSPSRPKRTSTILRITCLCLWPRATPRLARGRLRRRSRRGLRRMGFLLRSRFRSGWRRV